MDHYYFYSTDNISAQFIRAILDRENLWSTKIVFNIS